MDTEPAALGRIRTVAHILDESVRIPGTRFRVGLDPILGLLPIAGDVAMALCSLYIVAEAVRLGVPKRTVVRLLANIAVDATVGSVPVVGDLFDAYWKANVRNAELVAAAVAERQ
ncbi:hypothetical protein AMS69_07490 [Haloarcula rubripromontorii]|uniref:DUF4112 domain-containing protein n=1 Tax=Haloarcula rubripromontorii TaxID=1705562 RepID=A0A0N1IUN4_9EURY|nr:DUF4112 domain-containing protein [Haloarcula rubripromontorii]KOX93756.1 hypothetical protein AMS69_07490 [Haloarcula rubripromontorii]NLV05655.1 DUF4112 domain-containing protein [Haloarcula rubripromontorii]